MTIDEFKKYKKQYIETNKYELTSKLLIDMKNGDASEILYNVGLNIENGLKGFECSIEKAITWYFASAALNNNAAELRIAELYEDENKYTLDSFILHLTMDALALC